MRHEQLIIWQKAYNLARDLSLATERFPRPQQYGGLASEIRKTALELVREIMRANSDGAGYAPPIDALVDYLLVVTRMARDLRYISIGQYEAIAERALEIGRINGGWMKARARACPTPAGRARRP